MTRPFVKDRKDQIVDLAVNHGLTAADIAERYGCGRQSVSSVLNKAGYEWDRSDYRWVPQNKNRSSSESATK